METTSLLMEVNNDYFRTMNKIIFNKFLEENIDEITNTDMFPVKLSLPIEVLGKILREVYSILFYFLKYTIFEFLM